MAKKKTTTKPTTPAKSEPVVRTQWRKLVWFRLNLKSVSTWMADTEFGAFYVIKRDMRWYWYYGPEGFNLVSSRKHGEQEAQHDFERRAISLLK